MTSFCKSLKHDYSPEDSKAKTIMVFVKNYPDRSQIKHHEIENLIRNDFVKREEIRRLGAGRSILFCRRCLKEGGSEMAGPEVLSAIEKLVTAVKKLENKSVNGRENLQKLGRVMRTIASTQSRSLYKECDGLMKEKKTNQFLKDHSLPESFLANNDRNIVVMESLKGFTGFNPSDSENLGKARTFCHSYENILKTRHSHVVTPPSLYLNFRMLERTNKKTVVSHLGHPAGGSYYTSLSILHEKLPPGEFPKGDFTAHWDNMQIKDIKPNSRIQVNQQFRVNVKTSNTVFQSEHHTKTNVLSQEENMPKEWMRSPKAEDIEKTMETYEHHAESAEECRADFMNKIIQKAQTEIVDGEKSQIRRTLRLLAQNPKTQKFPCLQCNKLISMDTTTECGCGYSPLKGESGSHDYGFVQPGRQNHMGMNFQTVGDFNPSGYSGMDKLFQHIRTHNINRANKKLAVGVVDCRIFVDANRYMELRHCDDCNVDYSENNEEHENHQTKSNFNGDTLFVLGWGHLALLLNTTYIQTSWPVYMQKFIKDQLGFRTKNAQNTFFRGKNHRKAFQAVRVTTEAALLELATLYIEETAPPYDSNRFNLWARDRVHSPQAHWMYSFHFSFGAFLVLFHSAMRRNNVTVAKGCIFKLMPFLFATKHPLYRSAVLQDMINDCMMPSELRKFVDANRCGKRYRVKTDRQTGARNLVKRSEDFISQATDMLGEEILRVMMGTVERTSAAGNEFEVFSNAQLRCNFYGEERIRLEGTGLTGGPVLLHREVAHARYEFKKSGFLDSFGNQNKPFLSFDGKTEFDRDFHNMKIRGSDNFEENLSELSSGKLYSQLTKTVVPITRNDREKMEATSSRTLTQLYEDLKCFVTEKIKKFPTDCILLETLEDLRRKKASSFGPKVKLLNLITVTKRHVQDLEIDQTIFCQEESDDSDEEEDLL